MEEGVGWVAVGGVPVQGAESTRLANAPLRGDWLKAFQM